MGASEVVAFLSDLAVRGRVSAATQNQALSSLLFLYRHVLDRELEGLDAAVRARIGRTLPVVLTRDEVREAKRKAGHTKSRPRHYTYNYRPDDRQYSFSLRFRDRSEVDRGELIRTLQSILDSLQADEKADAPPRKSRRQRREEADSV